MQADILCMRELFENFYIQQLGRNPKVIRVWLPFCKLPFLYDEISRLLRFQTQAKREHEGSEIENKNFPSPSTD